MGQRYQDRLFKSVATAQNRCARIIVTTGVERDRYPNTAAVVQRSRRHGITLVETLVVIGVVALVAALVLPAVQRSRESSRRAECLSNLRQIGIAVQSYVALNRVFPPGSSFQAAILPQLELSNVTSLVDYSVGGLMPQNNAARNVRVSVFHCPSDGAAWDAPGTDYAGNYGSGVQAYGYNGIIRPLSGYYAIGEDMSKSYTISPASVADGLSNTAAAAEILIAVKDQPDALRATWQTPITLPLPGQLDAFATACENLAGPFFYVGIRGSTWIEGDLSYTGYNHVLPPNRKSCNNGQSVQIGAFTANSLHSGGVNVLRADGHVGFVSQEVDRAVWRALGSRNNGEAFSL